MANEFGVDIKNAQVAATAEILANLQLRIHVGALPGAFTALPAGALLVAMDLPAITHNPPSNGTATLASQLSGINTAGGQAGCYVVVDGNGKVYQRGDVTVTSGSGGLKLPSLALAAGVETRINAFPLYV